MATTEAEEIVNRFVAAWERYDLDELLAYFAKNAVWHPLPMEASVGTVALRKALSDWLTMCDQLRAEIHLQISVGNIVMHERTDLFLLNGNEQASPTAAVFEVNNGLITAWREYFDMLPFASFLGLSVPGIESRRS
jgi:limonene-1,2-epoxide hydrolase